MSFIRPELAARLRLWREPMVWSVLLAAGLWLIWRGYRGLEPLSFVAGLIFAAAGLGLLRAANRRLRLRPDEAGEGVVVIDEARIGYMGPRDGGVVDLPALIRVEIVTRPHLPATSAHAWVLSAEDGTRLTIPLGARGAEGLFDALSPLPGIDFDAGGAALAVAGPARTLVWSRPRTPDMRRLP